MIVLVCGSRSWSNQRWLDVSLIRLYREYAQCWTGLIHGDCPGADRMAGMWAKVHGIRVYPFPAHWSKEGPAAGPKRNQRMLEEGKPDLVLAFHEDIGASLGTMDMIRRANKAGVEVRLIGQRKAKP